MGQKSDSWEKDRELLPRRASEPFLGEDASLDMLEKTPLDPSALGFDIREVVCYTIFSGSASLPIVLIASYLQYTLKNNKLNSCLQSMCGCPKTIVSLYGCL